MNKYTDLSNDPFIDRETKKYGIPVPSREFILMTLGAQKHPMKAKQLIKQYQIEEPELIEAVKRRLKAMLRDGQLAKVKSGFVCVDAVRDVVGKLVVSKDGEGICITDDKQMIPLPRQTIRGLYEGDTIHVQVRHLRDSDEVVGRVTDVLETTVPVVVGRLFKHQSVFKVQPLDKKVIYPITVPKSYKGTAKQGDIVVVEILRETCFQNHREPVGEVVEILGDETTPGIEIDMAIKKFDIPNQWPKAVEKSCQQLPKQVTPQSKRQRDDLTDLNFVTIDGEDARDFDDAVYCEPYEKGWRLWVAIADVSFYVKPNSALDKEAYKRGNSTYFPEAVVPMLPEALSNELCSLKPNVDRLAFVCKMTINREGTVLRSTFSRCVIRSKARLTYTKVAAMFDGDKKLIKQYAQQWPSLQALLAVYQALFSLRQKRGALDLDTIESRILFDKQGKIESIIPTTRNVAHKLIEECMLATNVCAARFILRHKKEALFRVHDRPPKEKLNHLRAFIHELGLSLGGKDRPKSSDLSHLLSVVKKRPDRHMIETVILRSLSQAQYRPQNVGHFGLAYPFYVHFTSPIRRYPDLLIHRVIWEILSEKKKTLYSLEKLEAMGTHLSQTERRSDDATRDAVFALKCHFMLDKVGDVFNGVISGVTHFGLFVELKEIFVEGLVHVSQLGRDYYRYDPIKHCMIGEMSRNVFQLGQPVTVQVTRVDSDEKKIDLQLIEDNVFEKKSKKSKKRKKRR